MGNLRISSHDGPTLCAECDKAQPVGPCAACHSMICADCGALSKDPTGEKVICLSCARLVARVSESPVQRRPPGRVRTATLLLIVFGAGAAAALLRALW